jgi:hypothetical protein
MIADEFASVVKQHMFLFSRDRLRVIYVGGEGPPVEPRVDVAKMNEDKRIVVKELPKEIARFKAEATRPFLLPNKKYVGADLWSWFKNSGPSQLAVNDPNRKIDQKIIIITDGYLEFAPSVQRSPGTSMRMKPLRGNKNWEAAYQSVRLAKAGKRATIVAIIGVTFFFDCLLAYQIVHQIDTINILTGLTSTPWSLQVLVSSPEFWIILLAGFVVYIIWGMILQAVLEGVEKFHPARVAMRSLRESIKNHESAIDNLNKDLMELGRKEADVAAKISVLEQQKSPKEMKNNQFLRHIEEVMHGWLEFISSAYPDDRTARQAEAQRVRYETVQMLVGG